MPSIPKEKQISTIVNFIGIMVAFSLLAVLNESGFFSMYIQGIIVQCCYYVIMATSLNIAVGFLGQIALGHAGFMAIGAYTSALVTKAIRNADLLTGKDFFSTTLLLLIGILCGAVMAALFGLLVGIPALRLRGDYLAIITLGFGEIIRVIILNLPFAGGPGLSKGKTGQPLIGIPSLRNIYVIFFIMVICVAILFMFVRSRYGRAVVAIREDDIASEASGINNTFYKVLAFTISAFFAGVAGAVFAHRGLGTIQTPDFTFFKSTEYVVMVVLGGMGSLTGSVVAAIGLAVLPEALRAFSEYRMLVYSVVLVLVMIFRPIGLMGTYEFSLYGTLKRIGRLFSGSRPAPATAAAGGDSPKAEVNEHE